MDEILHQDDLDLVALGGGRDLAQQVLLAIGQHHPTHLLVRIAAHRLLESLLDHRPLIGLHAGPGAFVLRSRALPLGLLVRIQDLLGGARVGSELVDRDHRGHALAVLLLPGTEACVLFVLLSLQSPAGGLAQTLGVPHEALAIGADHQKVAFLPACLGWCKRLRRKGIEVLAQVHRHLLGLPLRHPPAAGAR